MQKPQNAITYKPDIFEVSTFEEAVNIVVTPDEGASSVERWEKETRFLVDNIGEALALGPDSCVLDYGCGPGRVAKGLIEKFGCRVIGVDFSKAMRLLAPEYVLSERFTIWSPEILDKMITKGFKADVAISLWVIQHVLDPMAVISLIAKSLPINGKLYCLNSLTRWVPTNIGWVNDGFDIRAGLNQIFKEEEFHILPTHATTPRMSDESRIHILRKQEDVP